MGRPTAELERWALRRSIVVGAALGAVGIGWGVLTGSQLILLDGAYAFIGVAVSWLLLLASRLVGRGPSDVYPYGREALTPLVVGVQGFVLLGTLVYASVDSVLAINAGGGEVAAGWALGYALLTTIGSIAIWRWMLRVAPTSDLVVAEGAAWRISVILGVGMITAFAAMLVVDRTSWDSAVPYIDPVMVLVTCVVLVPSPIHMVRTTFVELLEGAPTASVQGPVHAVIASVSQQFELDEPTVRMTKIGGRLYVEIDGRADDDLTIAQEHDIRRALEQVLDAMPFDVWLNFELRPRSA